MRRLRHDEGAPPARTMRDLLPGDSRLLPISGADPTPGNRDSARSGPNGT
jgi:hypothetical protein